MTISSNSHVTGLEGRFDTPLGQNQCVTQQNELLGRALLRHSSDAPQI